MKERIEKGFIITIIIALVCCLVLFLSNISKSNYIDEVEQELNITQQVLEYTNDAAKYCINIVCNAELTEIEYLRDSTCQDINFKVVE